MASISHIPEQFRDPITRYQFFSWLYDLPVQWTVKKNLMFLWARVAETTIDQDDLYLAGAEDPDRARST